MSYWVQSTLIPYGIIIHTWIPPNQHGKHCQVVQASHCICTEYAHTFFIVTILEPAWNNPYFNITYVALGIIYNLEVMQSVRKNMPRLSANIKSHKRDQILP